MSMPEDPRLTGRLRASWCTPLEHETGEPLPLQFPGRGEADDPRSNDRDTGRQRVSSWPSACFAGRESRLPSPES